MLLQRFPPAFPDVIADHVTLGRQAELPENVSAIIVGHASDTIGLETLVVEIDGTVDRPDGSIYHCTWSLDRVAGRKPIQSNDLLKARNWTRLDEPIAFVVYPSVVSAT